MPFPPDALYATQTLNLSEAPVAASHPTSHLAARIAVRAAQVALYCDHEGAALHALQRARRALLDDAVDEAVPLASLDAAAWQVRRHDAEAAQRTMAQIGRAHV